MWQQIQIIGHLGGEPETRFTPAGQQVTSFSVATSRAWTATDGQRQEKTVWFRVSAWQKLAETTSQYLHKGSKVLVIGEIEEPRVYTDRQGTARSSLDVRAQSVRFLDSKAESAAARGPGSAPEPEEQSIPF